MIKNLLVGIIDWFTDYRGLLAALLAICVAVGGIGWLIYADVNNYRGQCHDAGGHIISVKNEEICVDHDNRVIFL